MSLRQRSRNSVRVLARLGLALAVSCALFTALPSAAADGPEQPRGPQTLDFTLPVLTGGHWRLAEHRGREVWLALVAPWCGSCARFVDDAAARLRERASKATDDEYAPLLMVISARDARGAPLAIAPTAATSVLVDANDDVLRALDPSDLPWLVRIDEDGRAIAAGSDLDALAPVLQDDDLWQDLVSRWRQVWND